MGKLFRERRRIKDKGSALKSNIVSMTGRSGMSGKIPWPPNSWVNSVEIYSARGRIGPNGMMQTSPLRSRLNDDDPHLHRLGEYLGTLGAESVQVLPYHVLGVPKYEGLDRRYSLGDLTPHNGGRLREVRDLLRGYCDNVIVKGVD